MRAYWLWALNIAVLSSSAACGNDIVGDWFRCQSGSCETLTDDGLRFEDDGRFVGLDSTGSTLDPEEKYCESITESARGSYEFDGKSLTTKPSSGDEETVGFQIQEDRASVTVNEEVSTWLRIEPRSNGPCAPNRPQ